MHDTNTILIALVAVYGVSVLLQICVLVGLAILALRAMKMAKEYAEEARKYALEMSPKVLPVLEASHHTLESAKALIVRLEPKLDAAAGDLAEITRAAREETAHIKASIDEITERVRRQSERVDGMTTSTLNSVDRIGHFLNEAVNTPMRQASGVLAAARAVVDTLRTPSPQRRPAPDEEARTEQRTESQRYA